MRSWSRERSVDWTVDKVMTGGPPAVRPSTGYRELVRLMSERAASANPFVEVVDAAGRLVGIVSAADLSRAQERFLDRRRRRLGTPLDEMEAGMLVAGDLMRAPSSPRGQRRSIKV
jgi:CBS domain-containing protein